ncbi:MAG: 3'-5' exonuclease [Mariprofundales bacterium]
MKATVFVIDIETVTDADASRRLLGNSSLSDMQARDELAAYFIKKTNGKNDFPRQPFHQIVAISYVQWQWDADSLVVRRVASGCKVNDNEAALVQAFFQMIKHYAPQIISYNGRGFDLPVLKYRAMKHGISCPEWFSRKCNYDYRYSDDGLDLMEAFSDYGASARCSLNEIAACLSIPGKLDTAGSDVRDLYESGNVDAIRNYCEMDVLSTSLLWLRWLLLRGQLSLQTHANACLGLRHYLQSEIDERPYLQKFLDAWSEDEN